MLPKTLKTRKSPWKLSDLHRSLVTQESARFIEHHMETWVKHIDDFGYTRTAADKMPRADTWRPYRFAVQDVILAITAIRHSKAMNALEVDVFAACDPFYNSKDQIPKGQDLYPYEPLAATKALTLMLFSEAFRCGATMELRFTSNVERTQDKRDNGAKVGRVPFAILQLAKAFGTPAPDAESGVLKTDEAWPLYAALTGFPLTLRERINKLAADGLLTIARACYLVHHGVWTAAELEGIISSCPYPDLVLDGEVQPENRHLYHHAQVHTRTALLGGVLDRALLARDARYDKTPTEGMKSPKGRALGAQVQSDSVQPGKDVEDDERDLLIEFEPKLSARVYQLGPREAENLPLPNWCPFAGRGDEDIWKDGVGRQGKLIALLRPRDQAGMLQYLSGDIEAARDCPRGEHDCVSVVVPLDFNDLPAARQTALLKEAHDAKVLLLVCPETARTLDGYAREKLNRSRVLPE